MAANYRSDYGNVTPHRPASLGPREQPSEKQPASGPKTPLHVPDAVRFRAGKPEFSFFDTQSQDVIYPEQGDPDLNNFTEAVISEFEKHFRFDPFPRSTATFMPWISMKGAATTA
jgi:hypothetical protein